jgi:hypothetical protein
MALTAAQVGVLGIIDRWGFQSAAGAFAMVAGTDVWARVDAVGDEVFENRVKGQQATDLDTAIINLELGDKKEVLDLTKLLSEYAKLDLGYATFSAWLTALRLRIDYRAAQWLEKHCACVVGNIHGAADGGAAAPGQLLGSFVYSASFTAGTDLDVALVSPSPLLARVTTKGATDWTLAPVVKTGLVSPTTKTLSQVVAGTGAGGAVGDVYVLGKQALSGGAAAGQKVVPVAATAQFAVGQTVLITQWSGSAPNETWLEQEVGVIASIVANTSITLVENLLHTYTSAGFAYPCFTGISACTGSGGNASDAVSVYPAADRRLKA